MWAPAEGMRPDTAPTAVRFEIPDVGRHHSLALGAPAALGAGDAESLADGGELQHGPQGNGALAADAADQYVVPHHDAFSFLPRFFISTREMAVLGQRSWQAPQLRQAASSM